jgi:hypothetical protein
MTKNERFSFTSRLASLQGRAESLEDEVCKALNDLAAELIPTTPELTAEAARQLKNHSFHDLSRTIDAIMEAAAI